MSETLGKQVVSYVLRDNVFNDKLKVSNRENFCVRNGKENYKYYLKIGGIYRLNKNQIENLVFGGFSGHCLYFRRNGFLMTKLIASHPLYLSENYDVFSGPVSDVIPRCDGSNGKIICGLRIDDRPIDKRGWKRSYLRTNYEDVAGIEEFDKDYQHNKVLEFDRKMREKEPQLVSIYVNKKTTVCMIDTDNDEFESIRDLKKDKKKKRKQLYSEDDDNRQITVLQEGAFVIMKARIVIRFLDYDINQDYELRHICDELFPNNYIRNFVKHKKDLNLDLDIDFDPIVLEPKNPILFLLPSNGFHWGLRITNHGLNTDERRIVELLVPTGGRIETIMDWEEGLKEVKRRQAQNPWDKYIEIFERNETTRLSIFRHIIEKNEEYPKLRGRSGVTRFERSSQSNTNSKRNRRNIEVKNSNELRGKRNKRRSRSRS